MIMYIKKLFGLFMGLFRRKPVSSEIIETKKPISTAYKPQPSPKTIPFWRMNLLSRFIKFIPSTGTFVNEQRRRRKALCRKYKISNKKLRKIEIKARRLKTTVDKIIL